MAMVSRRVSYFARTEILDAMDTYLNTLNRAQLDCVQHSPSVPLQILAGPGSGKTKVLTSRIAHLILQHRLEPGSICAVTFTNKAANEMRTRLTKLIGSERTNQVKMGTFHSLCALFLRKYGTSVGLDGNFTICDADESKKIIAGLLKEQKQVLAAQDISLKEATILSMISKAKAKGHTPDHLASVAQTMPNGIQGEINAVVAELYRDYEKALRTSNSLDFDDLLVFGVKLFAHYPERAAWCRHVLVDEFQDTNTVQYELMRCIAATSKCVTIVGDPDQSIYGWRSAEIGNLRKMHIDFHGVKQIFLEQNYRSAGSILDASVAIISQDKARVPKTLRTSFATGPRPVLRSCMNEHEEASFIAHEIKRIVAHTGGLLGYGDFAVLLRFNALSRAIESALQKEGIPNRILGGHKFFERAEIKDLLAYLQLIDNPQFAPAFIRAVNTPGRGIGEKALSEILLKAEHLKLTPLAVVESICDSKIPDLSSRLAVKRKLNSFVTAIRQLRQLANGGTSPADLITRLLKLVDYEDHLKRTQPDWETRWENVQELINFASEANNEPAPFTLEDESPSQDPESSETPLRRFLQASMLSSQGDNEAEVDNKEKVTITTCHAAKGLEWPVVMIPAVEDGTFPFYRTEDTEEERRLLYVACTRAQSLLYLSHSSSRKTAGQSQRKSVSDFVSAVRKQRSDLFSDEAPTLAAADRGLMAKILNRGDRVPSETDVQEKIRQFELTTRSSRPSRQETFGASYYSKGFGSARGFNFDVPTTTSYFQNASSYPGSRSRSKSPRRRMSTSASSSGATPRSPTQSVQSLAPVNELLGQHKAHPVQTTLSFSAKGPLPPMSCGAAPGAHKPQNLPSSKPLQPKAFPSSNNRPPHPPPPLKAQSISSSPSLKPGPTTQSSSPSLPPTSAYAETGVKRRLGMGRTANGYSNKKFKAPVT
ncbi:P-loop containing nucleoside triphosphate hydrolase protein [Coniophora puteana RWD-64-598 SS2]|uniref:DNA 3'-5' helicase n=1 Tax=Coniophora puteana (strain RWD-64-598) TaxID=741705 RepID=A0A5M3MZ19_CONPW|nr:P-loop containing nucleoside triphosphate hydrolase protein [Coniophora puteana RWD-64-598 SS2]EIW84369.1 P-loop containing nucleoside triphosphate hydrolase protein [Coniophora puteana RWD-64-598 SS2]